MDPKQPHQHVDHNDVLQFGPRYKPGGSYQTDELVANIFHRTIGGGRSALMSRPQVEELHAFLGQWLAEGWTGTRRTCQDQHTEQGCTWECDQEPGHSTSHQGPPTGWRSDTGRPDRTYWANDQSRAQHRTAREPGRGVQIGDGNVQHNRF